MPKEGLLFWEIKRDCAEAKGRGDKAKAELLQLVLAQALSRDDVGILTSIRAIIDNADKLIADPGVKAEIKKYCSADKAILAQYLGPSEDHYNTP